MTAVPLERLTLPIISCGPISRPSAVSFHTDYASLGSRGLGHVTKRGLRVKITQGGILIGSNLYAFVETEPDPIAGERIRERLGDPFSLFFPNVFVPVVRQQAFGPVQISLDAAKIMVLSGMYSEYDIWDSGAEPFEYYQQKLIDAKSFQEICDALFSGDEIVE